MIELFVLVFGLVGIVVVLATASMLSHRDVNYGAGCGNVGDEGA